MILIDKNPTLLDQLATHLSKKYKRKTLKFYLNLKLLLFIIFLKAKNYTIEVVKIAVDLNDTDSYALIEKSIISRDIGILGNFLVWHFLCFLSTVLVNFKVTVSALIV